MKNNGCVVTNLCWTAPHQSPHSAPSDRTGLAWSRPLPPPQTGQPLWSTRTPPPYECRHLTDKCSQVIFFFCHHWSSAVMRSLTGLLSGTAGKQGRKTKRGLPLTLPSFALSQPLIFSSCLVSPPSCKFCLSCHICSASALFFHLVSASANHCSC